MPRKRKPEIRAWLGANPANRYLWDGCAMWFYGGVTRKWTRDYQKPSWLKGRVEELSPTEAQRLNAARKRANGRKG